LNRDDQITIKIQQTLFIMSLFQDIESIEDHRVDANKNYELSDNIFLTIAAILCGAKGWKAINIFGVAQLDWLKEYKDFSHGIPTRHSIGRIIRGLKADSLVSCFINFSNTVRESDGKGDYVLQVKKNQGKLLKEIEAYFHIVERDFPQRLEDNLFQELDGEHGRINEREYRLLPITKWFDETERFKDSFAVVQVKCTRQLKTKTEHETSYYITSLKEDAKTVAGYIRGHWAIENSQHWVLDVTFREDESQIYADDGAINLATIRRKLLNLIKAHPLKDSVAGKMQRACWDAKFRA
jgi:predicted transposase YbfD/YdcC